jgi:small nuclear ribonucleoprotein (snRNP)-like protein
LIKKQLAVLLSVFITALSFTVPLTTQAQATAEIDKTRSKVQSLSIKRDKKVEVKLRDNTKYKGYITGVTADSFTVSDVKTSASQRISYNEVVDVKTAGGGLSTKSWIIIGSVAAGAIITWMIVKPAFCDGGAQTRGIC